MTEPQTPPERPRGHAPVALWVSLAVLVLVAAIAVWRFTSLRAPPPPGSASAGGTAAAPAVAGSAVAPIGPVGPLTAESAFALAFPSPRLPVRTDDGSTNVLFAPVELHPLPEGGYVLLSRGDNMEDCHACSGFYAISYLSGATPPAVVGGPFVRAGGSSGVGPDLKVVEGLAERPLVQATSSYTGQGTTETNADFIWLGLSPAEVFVALRQVPIGYDNQGGAATCAISSKLRRGPPGVIEVVYSGSWTGRATWLKTGKRFEAAEPLGLYATCPDTDPG